MRLELHGRGFEPNLDPDSLSGGSKSERNHENGLRYIVASELSIIFFAKRDEQLREDEKIRANISKNEIKILNVWLVRAKNAQLVS